MAEDVPDAGPDAATRKLWRLMIEAEGAQHESIAQMALAQFNRDLAEDYAAANAAAEAEEIAAVPVTDETYAEVDAEEDAEDEPSTKGRGSRSRSRR